MAFRVNLRVLGFVGIALSIFLAMAAWALTLGSYPISLGEVVATLLGSGTDRWEFIVLGLRLPRIIAAGLAGPMLAMSGAIFQGLVRNPLVSPDIIGINGGAALVAVFWIVTGQAWQLLPVMAFLGALVTGGAIYLLSWRGHIAASRLVLVGIGMNALLSAGTTFLLVRAEIGDAQRAVLWTTGSLYASDWNEVLVLALGFAVLVPAGALLVWGLRVLQLGDDAAKGVGMRVEPYRLALLFVGCGLAAVPVSVAGPIGFVALMVPHVARMIAGPISGGVFVLSGLIGATLVLGADMVGQHALPIGLPVGVLTAAVGAPYFLYLLYRRNARL